VFTGNEQKMNRLYISQCLCYLVSLSLAWTNTPAYHLIYRLLNCNILLYMHIIIVPGARTVKHYGYVMSGNTKGGSITVQLTSCLTGLD
jgi:hypothetical protein